MKIVLISECLLGKPCRYDGLSKPNDYILNLIKDPNIKFITVCPECESGMSTPRIPSEIRKDKVINANGEDVTFFYNKGAQIALEKAKENNIDFAILKEKSPSCGKGKIYDGTFSILRLITSSASDLFSTTTLISVSSPFVYTTSDEDIVMFA